MKKIVCDDDDETSDDDDALLPEGVSRLFFLKFSSLLTVALVQVVITCVA